MNLKRESEIMASYQQWTEYDWTQWYKKNNEMAFRFLAALNEYENLPATESLIERKCPGFKEILTPDPELPPGMDGVMWIRNEDVLPNSDISGEFEGFVPSFDENTTLQHPVCQSVMQDLSNWANILALFLPDHLHLEGVTVLFHISRALTLAVYSIVDRNYPAPTAPLMLVKRSYSHLCLALQTLKEIEKNFTVEVGVLLSIKEHLLYSIDLITEHLLFTQKQVENRNE